MGLCAWAVKKAEYPTNKRAITLRTKLALDLVNRAPRQKRGPEHGCSAKPLIPRPGQRQSPAPDSCRAIAGNCLAWHAARASTRHCLLRRRGATRTLKDARAVVKWQDVGYRPRLIALGTTVASGPSEQPDGERRIGVGVAMEDVPQVWQGRMRRGLCPRPRSAA